MLKKPIPKRVPSDDCIVTVAGEEYTPHEGEWIEVIPIVEVRELQILRYWDELRVKLESAEGEEDEETRQLILMDDAFRESLPWLASRIVSWSWTDLRGRELPQPAEDESVLARLSLEEVMYLVAATRGETPGEQKNGSRPSPTSSLDTAPQLVQTS